MKNLARHAIAALAAGTRLWPAVPAGRAVVLRYHRVAGSAADPMPLAVTPEEFDAQVRFLRARCRLVAPREIVEAVAEERPLLAGTIAITFDDGYEDNFSNALPILKRYDAPAAFFVAAGWIGSTQMLWWDRIHEFVRQAAREGAPPTGWESLPRPVAAALASAHLRVPAGAAALEHELVAALRSLRLVPEALDHLVEQIAESLGADEPDPERYHPMNWEQVVLLRQAGMEIGSHTMTHARLASVPAERAHDELEESKKTIEKKLGEPIDLLAYPAGDTSRDVAELAVEVGYGAAFTTEAGPILPGDDALSLRRIGVWSGGYDGAFGGFSPSVFGLQIGRLARGRKQRISNIEH